MVIKTIGDEVTEELINEEFPTKEMQIEHLKEVSDAIKSDPELKQAIQKELESNPLNETKEEKFEKTKSLLLSKLMTKKYNGFSSLFILSLITLLFSGGSLLYLLMINGFFK